jgi:hypothetical protein
MKVLLPRGTKPWDFVVFGGGFVFPGSFFLFIHTSHKIISTYVTTMHQLKVGIDISVLLIAYIGSYLSFSIPHPPEMQPILYLTFSPKTTPKFWALKMS